MKNSIRMTHSFVAPGVADQSSRGNLATVDIVAHDAGLRGRLNTMAIVSRECDSVSGDEEVGV